MAVPGPSGTPGPAVGILQNLPAVVDHPSGTLQAAVETAAYHSALVAGRGYLQEAAACPAGILLVEMVACHLVALGSLLVVGTAVACRLEELVERHGRTVVVGKGPPLGWNEALGWKRIGLRRRRRR